jgi:hypothetical protein
MSGLRVYNFREGDRSEYLANYLLSGLGLVTPVPRQEDIGFDFYCQLADQEQGNLTFGFPFIVQVKSENETFIKYGELDKTKWKPEQVKWIFRLQQPIFFAFIEKNTMKMSIYNCSPLAFDYYTDKIPSVIEFKKRIVASSNEIGRPYTEDIANWDSDKGDGKKHIVDLGNPIITITNDDIYDKEILKKKKSLLRLVIEIKQQNILYKTLGLPYLNWVLKIKTDESIQVAWSYFDTTNPNILPHLYKSLTHSLISLALNLKSNNEQDLLNSLKPILKKLPTDRIPNEAKLSNPEFFN